ncbi:MAG TPA: GlsB/YeaQ/YmgE family stress response membrane protein [Pseudomonadota bacterium]|nr:GlsB/YeaQ/YmgE family stress response membrane protein [Pseudomonadota bacterium]HRI49997.1 GlsB/YeaQ/YmgE family stress response membrane protein [Pseudomonadota bacterium]
MAGNALVVLLIVGLVAGWLASVVLGGGFGVVGDILVGVAGAYIGGPVLRALGIHVPWRGITGQIVVAFVGALVLLLVIRAVRRILSS